MSLGVLDASLYPIIVAVSVLTTFTTPMFIKMSLPVCEFVERHLPGRLRFLIDRYQKNVSQEQASTALSWFELIKKSLARTMLYAIVLVAITIVARQYLLGWLDRVISDWSHALTLTITLAAMAPFLMALVSPLARVLSALKKGDKQAGVKLTTAGIVMAIFSFIIALFFASATIIWLYSMTAALSVGLSAVLLIVMIFSSRVRRRMAGIETRFLDNLNERELSRRGTNNTIVHDLHLAYMTLGSGSEFLGQRLCETKLRDRYGVNVVSLQRSSGELFPMPPANIRLFPGDVLGVIGVDEQLESLLPAVEASNAEANPASSDYTLFSVRLDANSPLVGKTPRTSRLRNNYDAVVLAVERGEEFFDQNPDLQFNADDILWLYGDRHRLQSLKNG